MKKDKEKELKVLDKNIEVVNKNKGSKTGLINANTTVNINTGEVSVEMDDNTTKAIITGIVCSAIVCTIKILKN
jgi:hypothetical protein